MAFKQAGKTILKILFIVIGVLLLGMILLFTIYYFQIHRSNGEIISSGEKRTYWLYVPENYNPKAPVPLVISMHGFADWPAHQMEMSGWNQLADENNFIAVYPSGSGFPLRWRAGGPANTHLDFQFISDLIDQIETDYNIDEARIYANGLSNGAGMSFVLACELSQRITAFGGVAGAYLLPWEDCDQERPIPAIIFHGTEDQIVPFTGGESHFPDFSLPDITSWVSDLAAKNGCSADPENLPTQGKVSGKRYTDCNQDAEILFYVIEGGGHSWPGGGYLPEAIVGHTTQDIDATRTMWEFFKQHPMQ